MSHSISNSRDTNTNHGNARGFRAPNGAHGSYNVVDAMAFPPVPARDNSTNNRQTGSSVLISESQAESLLNFPDSVRPGSFHDSNNISTIGQGYGTTRQAAYMGAVEDEESGAFNNTYNRRLSGKHANRPSQESALLGMGTTNGHASASQDNGHPPSRGSGSGSGHSHTLSNSSATRRPSLPAHASGLSPQANANGGSTYAWNPDLASDSDLSSLFEHTLNIGHGRQRSFAEPGRGFNSLGNASNLFSGGSSSAAQRPADMRPSGNSFSSSSAMGPGNGTAAPMPFSLNSSPFTPNAQLSPSLGNAWAVNPPSNGARLASQSRWRSPGPPSLYPSPTHHDAQFHASHVATSLYALNGYNPNPYTPNAYTPNGHTPNPYSLSGYNPNGLPTVSPTWSSQLSTAAVPSEHQATPKKYPNALLAEFNRRPKGPCRWPLRQIYGNVVAFCGDQQGSRFLQEKLAKANSDEKEQVFRELQPNLREMSNDVYGNYVIQKLLEHGNQAQKREMVDILVKGKMTELYLNQYGCRVVQKALELVLVEQKIELARELEPNLFSVIRNESGNHVVQKVIESLPHEHFDYITRAFRGRVAELAEEQYACRIIQRLMEYAAQDDKEAIFAEIHESAQRLVTSDFGNYVVQHVLEVGAPAHRERMIASVLSRVVPLSKHKFSSNVVEKCIIRASPQVRLDTAQALIRPGSDGTNAVPAMYRDNYGNYVLQTLLKKLTHGAELLGLIAALESIPDVRKHLDEIDDPPHKAKTTAADRVLEAVAKARGGSKRTGKARSGNASTSRNTRAGHAWVDASTEDTPVLTMEPNSPQSSEPPSANASSTGESTLPDRNGQFASGSIGSTDSEKS